MFACLFVCLFLNALDWYLYNQDILDALSQRFGDLMGPDSQALCSKQGYSGKLFVVTENLDKAELVSFIEHHSLNFHKRALLYHY